MFDDELNAYATEIVQGMLDAAGGAGAVVAVAVRGRRGAVGPPVAWARELVATGREAVIGVVNSLTAGHVTALARAGLPLVVIDPIDLPRARVTSVGATNFAGGVAAARHLLSLGHRRVAYVGGSPTAACSQARMHGFRAAMEAAGLPVPDGYVRDGLFRYQDGVDGAAALFALPAPPTAVFAACDEVAAGVVEAARAHGLRVPEDLSVVGFDDTQLARLRLAAADHRAPAAARDGRGRAAHRAADGGGRGARLAPRRAGHRARRAEVHRAARRRRCALVYRPVAPMCNAIGAGASLKG